MGTAFCQVVVFQSLASKHIRADPLRTNLIFPERDCAWSHRDAHRNVHSIIAVITVYFKSPYVLPLPLLAAVGVPMPTDGSA